MPMRTPQKLHLTPDEPLSVYVESAVPLPSSEHLEDIHNQCKGLDGYAPPPSPRG